MSRPAFYIINGITIYRILAAPVLIWLIYSGNLELFKWLLGVSFFTDLIDGFLARRFHVESVMGTRLDSIGDDLTILAGFFGMYFFKHTFFMDQLLWFYLLGGLFVIQTIMSFIRYGKTTSFHTVLAKMSAILQGSFMLLLFFLPQPIYILFYVTIVCTGLELLEEIVLTYILKEWRANVKGLYWVVRDKNLYS